MRKRKIINYVLALVFIIALFGFYFNKNVYASIATSGDVDRIHFLNVGQADSILIESQGEFGLVDAAKKGNNVYKYLEQVMGDKKLKFIVLTHSHTDHTGGFRDVVDRFVDSNTVIYVGEGSLGNARNDSSETEIRLINAGIATALDKGATVYEYATELTNENKYKNITKRYIKNNGEVEITTDQNAGNNAFALNNFSIDILNRERDANPIDNIATEDNDNKNSLIELVTHIPSGKKTLLTGDLSFDDESRFVCTEAVSTAGECRDSASKDLISNIDILKLAHHCLYSSNSIDFLNLTNPKDAIITQGWYEFMNDVPINYVPVNYLESKNTNVYMTSYDDRNGHNFDDDENSKKSVLVTFSNSDYTITDASSDPISRFISIEDTSNLDTSWVDIKYYDQTSRLYFDSNHQLHENMRLINENGVKNCYMFSSINSIMLKSWVEIFTSRNGEKVGKFYYFSPVDGKKLAGEQVIDGKTYNFDSNTNGQGHNCSVQYGYLKYEGFLNKQGDDWYYIEKVGEDNEEDYIVYTGWKTIDGKKYYFEPTDYFFSNGLMVKGFKTLKDEEDNNTYTYYFDQNGVMQTGWIEDDGNKYYADENGHLLTRTHDIVDSEGVSRRYYFNPNTYAMLLGFNDLNGDTYYFNENNNSGELVKGFFKVGDNWYCSNKNGKVLKQDFTVSGVAFHPDKNGVLQDFNGVVDKPTNSCSNPYYDGTPKNITISPQTGYTFNDNIQTEIGTYTVTATLSSGYAWSDNTAANYTFDCDLLPATGNVDNIHFINVGRADSMLIESQGEFGLVDTAEKRKNVYKYLEQVMGNRKLKFIVLTHSHADHTGGLQDIVDRFVDSNTTIYFGENTIGYKTDLNVDVSNPKAQTDYTTIALQDALKKGATAYDYAIDENDNSVYTIGFSYNNGTSSFEKTVDTSAGNDEFVLNNFTIKILNREKDLNVIDGADPNSDNNRNSLLELITHTPSGKTTLLTGDLEKDDEHRFLCTDDVAAVGECRSVEDKNLITNVDIFKMGHHGSVTSNVNEFLDLVNPKTAIVTLNRFENIEDVTLSYEAANHLESNNADIYMTSYDDADGHDFDDEDDSKKALLINFTNNDYSVTDAVGNSVERFVPVEDTSNLNSGWIEIKYYDQTGYLYYYPVNNNLYKGMYAVKNDGVRSCYYFAFNGIMQTGWLNYNNKMYYYSPEDGKRLLGDQTIDGKSYTFESTPLTSGTICGADYGYLMTEGLINTEGNDFYYNERVIDGEDEYYSVATGWKTIDDNRYYFDPDNNGLMVRDEFKNIEDEGSTYRYYFDEDGVMKTGWIEKDGNKYYADENGHLLTRTHDIVDSEGVSRRYYFSPNTYAMLLGFNDLNGDTYYFNEENNSGELVKGFFKVGDNWYCSNKNGKVFKQDFTVSGVAFHPDENGVLQDFNGAVDKPSSNTYCEKTYYDGTAQTITKEPGEGYTFSNNVQTNVGTYAITATLSTGYAWSDNTATPTLIFNCDLSNARESIESATITVDDQTYTGEELKPDIKVTIDNKTLRRKIDYTVSYSNNTNLGNATVTITGVGDYYGEKSENFEIVNTGDYAYEDGWHLVPAVSDERYSIWGYYENGVETKRYTRMIYGHRGWAEAPSNSLAGFELVKENGFYAYELDVRFTSDHVAVLNHEKDINKNARNDDGSALESTVYIRDVTYEDLLQYSFVGSNTGQALDDYLENRITKFEDALRYASENGMTICIELKDDTRNSSTKYTEEEILSIVDMVHEYGMDNKVMWLSNYYTLLGYVKNYDENEMLRFYNDKSNGKGYTDEQLERIYNGLYNGKNIVLYQDNHDNWNNTFIIFNTKELYTSYATQHPMSEYAKDVIPRAIVSINKTEYTLVNGVEKRIPYVYDGDGELVCVPSDYVHATCEVDTDNSELVVTPLATTDDPITISVKSRQGVSTSASNEVVLNVSIINQPRVTFHANNGTETSTTQNFTSEEDFNLTKNSFEKSGYNFIKWNTQANGSGSDYTDEQTVNLSASIDLYAQWEEIPPATGTITFHSNNGEETTTTQEFTLNKNTTLNYNGFLTPGYRFVKWNTKANGTGSNFTDGQTVVFSASIDLYAQWEQISTDIVINNYEVDDTNKYISRISVNTTVENFKNNIVLPAGYRVEVDYKTIDNKNVLYTGGKTKIYNGSTLVAQYTNVVTGDINGDGAINSADLLKERQHLLGINTLEGFYFLAADINNDNEINSADLLRIRQHLIGTVPIE